VISLNDFFKIPPKGPSMNEGLCVGEL